MNRVEQVVIERLRQTSAQLNAVRLLAGNVFDVGIMRPMVDVHPEAFDASLAREMATRAARKIIELCNEAIGELDAEADELWGGREDG